MESLQTGSLGELCGLARKFFPSGFRGVAASRSAPRLLSRFADARARFRCREWGRGYAGYGSVWVCVESDDKAKCDETYSLTHSHTWRDDLATKLDDLGLR